MFEMRHVSYIYILFFQSGVAYGGGPKRLARPSDISRAAKRCRLDALGSLTENTTPPPELLEGKSESEREIILKNWVSMKSFSHKCKTQSVFNIRLTEGNIDPQMEDIFSAQSRAFKVNASVGVTVRHNSTGRLRYFHASNNNSRLFPEPFLVQSRAEYQQFLDALHNCDFTQSSLVDTDGSQWSFHDVNNLSIYVNHLDHPIRAGKGRKNCRSGAIDIPSDHNLCFFACLAAHINPDKVKAYVDQKVGIIRVKKETENLYRMYTQQPLDGFPGVTMSDLDHIEKKIQHRRSNLHTPKF